MSNGVYVKKNGEWINTTDSGVTVDSTLSTTSENPVQNKVITEALGGKADSDHIHRIYNALVPSGTSIGEYADLNSVEYLKVGNYYCNNNDIMKTLVNSPTRHAFMMQVYAPLKPDLDDETTNRYAYRVRKLMTYSGEDFIQTAYSDGTPGVFYYTAWEKMAKASSLATKQDKLTAGANITISGTTISATDTTYGVASASANGLMSSTDKSKLDGVTAGAQPNVIETVKVNNSAVSVSDKAVNIDLSGYALKSDISSVYKVKGSVGSVSGLPSNASIGDVYNVTADGSNYVWTGSEWDALGGTVDLSSYAKRSDIPDVSGLATKTELTNGLSGKADKSEIPDVSGLATKSELDRLISFEGIVDEYSQLLDGNLFELTLGTEQSDGSRLLKASAFSIWSSDHQSNLVNICKSGIRYKASCKLKIPEGSTATLLCVGFYYTDGTYGSVERGEWTEWTESVIISPSDKTVSGVAIFYGQEGDILIKDFRVEALVDTQYVNGDVYHVVNKDDNSGILPNDFVMYLDYGWKRLGGDTSNLATKTELTNGLSGKASTSVATTSANGLMSSGDKSKLDGIESGANKTVVDSYLDGASTNPLQNKVVNNAIYNLGVQIRAEIPKITASTTDIGEGSSLATGTLYLVYE